MIVAKFGGTSVGSADSIKQVISISSKKEDPSIVVVSALGGITNQLIEAANLALSGEPAFNELLNAIQQRHIDTIDGLMKGEGNQRSKEKLETSINTLRQQLKSVALLEDLSDKTMAKIVGTGEILSSFIIVEAMKEAKIDAALIDSREVIRTDSNYLKAQVAYGETNDRISEAVSKNNKKVLVFPGFISSDSKGTLTTLGRGGSDFTAALIANAVDADLLEIWTDVSGMYTANPRMVRQARPIEKISYQEAMELSHFGAKVLYPPTVQPVLEKSIPMMIKNTLKPEEAGTLISDKANGNEQVVKGISHIENSSLLTLEGNGMIGVPGISKRLFGALAEHRINIHFITQASSEHSITFAVDDSQAEQAKRVADEAFEFEIFRKRIQPVSIESGLAIIALVGDQMKSHQGISGKMFSELGYNNVNIRAIAQGSTEMNISAVIDAKDVRKALNSLHAAFFEDHIKQLNLFVVGIGNVGSKLLTQIKEQQSYLMNELHLNLRVIGIANSRKMLFDADGLNLNDWEEAIEKGQPSDLDSFVDHIKSLNLRNSVFVDNTASDLVPGKYASCLKESISVVACNKIACSGDFHQYRELKSLARKYRSHFLFETNVGAGLPIIDTLNNLIASGDHVTEIQAVLSGSLNFIFNNFNDKSSFYDVVIKAGEEGYTEPDPRIDLSGVDVMRKILILMRESGLQVELTDIDNDSFLPVGSMEAESVADFLEVVKSQEDHFRKIYEKAANSGKRLKYVASFKDGAARVGLQEVAPDHPFYHLDGKDNIVLFYTNRYEDQPLIIKGAGAGAQVTASGIFGDIIRTGNH